PVAERDPHPLRGAALRLRVGFLRRPWRALRGDRDAVANRRLTPAADVRRRGGGTRPVARTRARAATGRADWDRIGLIMEREIPHVRTLQDHFLIAMPAMGDPNFNETVTYICKHDEEGAMGIVINRPTDMLLSEIFRQLSLEPVDPRLGELPVLAGGPVQRDRGFIVHRSDQHFDSTLETGAGIRITVSQDVLASMARGEGPDPVLVALGYAGWDSGQLEAEIAANAWLSVPADHKVLFETPFEQRWRAAAGLLGVDIPPLASYAGHAGPRRRRGLVARKRNRAGLRLRPPTNRRRDRQSPHAHGVAVNDARERTRAALAQDRRGRRRLASGAADRRRPGVVRRAGLDRARRTRVRSGAGPPLRPAGRDRRRGVPAGHCRRRSRGSAPQRRASPTDPQAAGRRARRVPDRGAVDERCAGWRAMT